MAIYWKPGWLGVILIMLAGCASPGGAPEKRLAAEGSIESVFELKASDKITRALASEKAEGMEPALSTILENPATMNAWFVSAKPETVSHDKSVLSVPLPDGKAVRFNLRQFGNEGGLPNWIGDMPSGTQQPVALPGQATFNPFGWASLLRDGNQVVGDIHVGEQVYRLYPLSQGRHVLVQVDEAKLPPEAKPIMVGDGRQPEKKAGTERSTIRVLFVTTNQRRQRSPNYRAELINALAESNQFLRNSDVAITYQLAGFYDADYDETGQVYKDQLYALKGPDTPLARAVYIHRDELQADLVSMYSTASEYCGMAFASSTKGTGYTVVSCLNSLAHELAHNLGGGDGWQPDPASGYNHGYKHETDPVFHTRMVTSHGAIPYFSNPRLSYQGLALGTERHDMARQMNDYRETIENFYPSPEETGTRITNVARQQAGAKACLKAEGSTVVFAECFSGGALEARLWKREQRPSYFLIKNFKAQQDSAPDACLKSNVLAPCPDIALPAQMMNWTKIQVSGNRYRLQTTWLLNNYCLAAQDGIDTLQTVRCKVDDPKQQWEWQSL